MNTRADFSASALVAPMNIISICSARDASLSQMRDAISAIEHGYGKALDAAQTAKGATNGRACYLHRDDNEAAKKALFPDFNPDEVLATYKRSLDAAVWLRIVEETGLKEIMDRTERDVLDAQMAAEDMPEPTLENIRATLERLTGDAEMIFRRGVARAFSDLDPAFKSHDAFRIKKRMIFNHVFDDSGYWSYGGWGEKMRRTLADVERVFSQLDGNRGYGMLENAINAARHQGWGARQTEVETEYFTARCFKNGNIHLWIKSEDLLRKVNRVLAAYYGEVLPDAAASEDQPKDFRPGTAVSKDLAFYPTPAEVTESLLIDLNIQPGTRVLEPSAGVGGIARFLLAQGARVDAIEIHPQRAETLRGIGHPDLSVRCENFLKVRPAPVYDLVLMNPPFSGTHWMDHVRHAFDFLAPGGELRAVLPVTAQVGSTAKHERFRSWAEANAPKSSWKKQWRDLPAESFASVGVKINTVILTLLKSR